MGDIIVERFDYRAIRRLVFIPYIVVYFNPDDYLGKYVARLFDTDLPTNLVVLADDYESLLAAIPAAQMTRFPRSDCDDPVIVETWM